LKTGDHQEDIDQQDAVGSDTSGHKKVPQNLHQEGYGSKRQDNAKQIEQEERVEASLEIAGPYPSEESPEEQNTDQGNHAHHLHLGVLPDPVDRLDLYFTDGTYPIFSLTSISLGIP